MWSFETIKRLLLDFSLKATNSPFTGDDAYYKIENADWKNDIGLNSIELMQLAALSNSFFHLFELESPPYLLNLHSVTDWVEAILLARESEDTYIRFNTSSTTGKTKTIQHKKSFIQREINALANLFNDTTYIIPYVPSYSIYGFLFTIGLAQQLRAPILYPSAINWNKLPPKVLIVGTPFHWDLLLKSLPVNKLNCYGVSAGAALHKSLFSEIEQRSIVLTDIYGTTETGGIGYRRNNRECFTLFPYWKLFEVNNQFFVEDIASKQRYTLMDDILSEGENRFMVEGRKDNMINIAGVLTNLTDIKTLIENLTNITSCSINAKTVDSQPIIEAFISLKEDNEIQRALITKTLRTILAPHEMPKHIRFNT